jgi:hypothetical protein
MPRRSPRLLGLATATLLALSLLLAAAASAEPPAPLMDFVPQEAGIYDTHHVCLTEQDCRACHGSSTSDRHHYSPDGLAGACQVCHEGGPEPDTIQVITNCRSSNCHPPLSDSPHHITAAAYAMQCTSCHNPQLLGNFAPAVDPAVYPPQVSVPVPASCQNCHRFQLVSDPLPSTDCHYVPGGGLLANGYFDLPGFSLQPLEMPQETGQKGWLYSKLIQSNDGNHHVGGLYHDCAACHAYPDGHPGADPTEPVLIRYCERCHSPASLHAVRAHVDAFEGMEGPRLAYNSSGWEAAELSGSEDATIYRPFSREERCAGCHGSVPEGEPATSPVLPYLDSLSPASAEPGTNLTLSGSGFGGQFDPGCRVQIRVAGSSSWLDLPPATWESNQISVRLPYWGLPEGNHYVRILTPAGTSNELVFTRLRCACVLAPDVAGEMDAAGLNGDFSSYSPLYSKVTLSNHGFFGAAAAAPLSTAASSAGVNVFTQIMLELTLYSRQLVVADASLRPTTGPNPLASLSGTTPPVTWGSSQISFRLTKFWEDFNSNCACDGEKGANENVAANVYGIPAGLYKLRLRQVYWKDWNGNGLFDQPNPLDAADPANEAILISKSEAANLTISSDPYIKTVNPKPVKAEAVATLVGINFGIVQGDSTVNIYKIDGVTLITRFPAEHIRMRSWTDGRFKFKMPGKPKQVRWISVTVAGKESNRMKVKLAAAPVS